MDLRLKGRRALVTGSTAGIGLAIAEALAREGAAVVVNGRGGERVAATVRALGEAGGDVAGLAADLATPEGAEEAIARHPDVDILVNNLGIYEPKPFERIADADWARMIEANFMSGVRLCRHHLPRMKARGWGRVLFVSSESAVNIPVEMIHYGVTKTMQVALARGLAETCAGTEVTVNSVLAGPTRSEGVGRFVEALAAERGVDAAEVERDFFASARPSSLLRRFAEPAEVAAVVAFLASPLASATNGAAVRAEGGVVRSIL
jgi:NAD(P)-dependent dehydrogenase (short-subunit alcohol dehydrogenase family)